MASEILRHAFRAFTTTCALITTDGPEGPNVMAAEWTLNVSYDPFLILVAVNPANKTHDILLGSKEFDVNLVSEERVTAMAFAGHYSKADPDKISSEAFEVRNGSQITRMIVVDGQQRIVGMLTRVDLLRAVEGPDRASGPTS